MLKYITVLIILSLPAFAQGGPDGVSTTNPIWIPPLQAGQFGTFVPMVPQVRSGAQTITHPFSGLTIVSTDSSGVTYTAGTPATAGDTVCFIQGSTGAITFSGFNSVSGVPTTTTGQYARECTTYIGSGWVLYQ